MTIEHNAFQNCLSLQKLVFNKTTEPVFTNIVESNNLPSSYQIIVPDNIKEKQIEIELCNNKSHVKSFADIKKLNIQQQTANYDIAFAIFHLKCCKVVDMAELAEYLIKKYNVSKDVVDAIASLLYNI